MFELKTRQNGYGRRGKLQTRSGMINTPFFMPDATRGSVRGVLQERLQSVDISAMVVNTYHLMLSPGVDCIKHLGGIHAFMGWRGPLVSDSGGYQVYSLIHKHPKMGRITEEGAQFRSVIDGSMHLLTPEKAIEIQFDLGVDMMVCLDDPRPNDASKSETRDAVQRTLRWAKRCKEEYTRQVRMRQCNGATRPLLFSVVQGGTHQDLRKICSEGLMALEDFSVTGESAFSWDGYGFGARHVDSEGKCMEDVLAFTASMLPEDKLRFALGVGTPEDIVRCWHLGWDMFDCVIPTREGRHGRLFFWEKQAPFPISKVQFSNKQGRSFYKTMNITNGKFREDTEPIDSLCDCAACAGGYSRGYIHHLFRVREPLGPQLATIHNLRFYMQLMEKLRRSADAFDYSREHSRE